MAFLDNSGDIILDAVLTDIGRKRLADGNFSIEKYGLGDDEINYGSYVLNHSSGSAYADLEIMQTPIFESTTSINSNINYGLLNIMRTDLLYLPVMEFNTKLAFGTTSIRLDRSSDRFYIAVNQTSSDAIVGESTTFPHMIQGGTSAPMIMWESGLNTEDIAATAANKSTFLGSSLTDTTFTIHADSKFVTNVGVLGSSTTLSNLLYNNTLQFTPGGVDYFSPLGSSRDLSGFNEYRIRGIDNQIYEPDNGDDNNHSNLKGPRGTLGSLQVQVAGELSTEPGGTRSRLYDDYGTVNSTAAGTGLSKTYDFIDTTIYAQGDKSGATIQVPVRLIRYVSG